MASFKQGFYKVKNRQKYNGNPDNVIYRSSWELYVLKYLDDNPNVIWWSSEELAIPYISPIDQKPHRYFPDFIIKVKDKTGKEKIHVWEVKPFKQTQQPTQKRKTKQFIHESVTYAINQEKWRAADIYCKKQGWSFSVITEKELGL